MKLLNVPGNLGALKNWLSSFGSVQLVNPDNLDLLDNNSVLILPGGNVGGFSTELASHISISINYKSLRIFAICGSFQSLFSGTEENNKLSGLDLFQGCSVCMPKPRIGMFHINSSWFNGNVYFNHSYAVRLNSRDSPQSYLIDSTGYVVAVRTQDILGVQFHPEISQSTFDQAFQKWLNVK